MASAATASSASASGLILIPVHQSEEVIEVQISELPDNVEEVQEILQAELAPLDLWLRFAVEYYRQGKLDSFLLMLSPLVELHDEPTATSRSGLFEQFGDNKQTREQFLAILNALAAFHTVLGSRERDRAKKKTEFDKAKRYYDSAEGVDLLKGTANVGRAVLQLAKGELGRAEKTLAEVDAFNRKSVPALLGKACAKFNSGNVNGARDALKLYRQVFEINPHPPPTVRLGLAYCYNKLGQTRLAQRALERTLALQEDCVEAMVGLAVLHLNEDQVEEALTMLKRAYELEPYNPSVLNHLASHFFYKGQYAKAQTLAKRALDYADAKAIRAESSYHMARCAHATNDYKTARAMYLEATRNNPDYLAPQFGLGQMLLENNELKKAAVCFERVIKADKANVEALKVLGFLYGKEGRDQEALQMLTKATEEAPQDEGCWLELAKLQQRLPGQLAAANKAYEKAAGLIKKLRTVPAEIWNNLGAIRHRLGKLDTAEQAYGYALKVRTLKGVDEYDVSCVSTQYNLGRLYEDQGEVERAINKYKAILERYPNYLEAFLRLTACEEAAGRPAEAIGWAQKVLMIHPRSADAYCQLGNLYLAVNDLRKAEGTFTEVLKLDGCEADTYATNQLACIQLKLAAAADKAATPSTALSAACAAPPSMAKVDKATELYRKVLETEPNNLYGANGLGVVCVAKGRLHEAMQIFTQVREASSACEHATLNLAQLNAALAEHATATSLYEAAAKKLPKGTKLMQLRLLRARNLFDCGELLACRKVLQHLVVEEPLLQVGWHNLGLTYLNAARHPDSKAYAEGIDVPPPRTSAAVAAAQRDLAHARGLLDTADPALLASAVGEESAGDATPKTKKTLAALAGVDEDAGDAAAAADCEGEGTPADKAVAAALEANLVGASAPTTKAATSFGLTTERREQARKACDKVQRELHDEAERAAELESKFREDAALAEAQAAEFAAVREKKAAEAALAAQAAEEAKLAAIAEQKAKLAAKMESWREADQREAEAARAPKRRRKEDDGGPEARSDDGDAGPGGVRPEPVSSDDEAAKSASDDDDDLFGSDDAKSDDDDDDDAFEEGDDKSDDEGEGEGDDDEAKAARKAAKAAAKAERLAAKTAAKEAKQSEKAAKKAKKAEKLARRAAKEEKRAAKAARKAAMDAAAAAAVGDDDGAADEEADLFGSDDDDAPAGEASGGGGGRLVKKRKIMEEGGDQGGATEEDAEADLFGDDDEEGADAAAAESAPKKRKAIIDDDEED